MMPRNIYAQQAWVMNTPNAFGKRTICWPFTKP
jgi:hypothetical protein